MLEALSPEALRAQLGLQLDTNSAPAIGSVATSVRACVGNWRFPARARVTGYLHHQLIAAGLDEQQVRDRVADVLEALIDIGDLTPARLDGRACLILSRSMLVAVGSSEHVLLGGASDDEAVNIEPHRYARTAQHTEGSPKSIDFADWLGQPAYRLHLARRASSTGDGTIAEYWAALISALRYDSNPIDITRLRAVIAAPGSRDGWFGRYNLPTVSGRWSTSVPDGTWCAVRPGRSENEWHPILAHIADGEARALDLFDWDEWNWALLARGAAVSAPERSHWSRGVLSFEHPIPNQLIRGLRLLGGPAERPWTWALNEASYATFDTWRREWF